MPALSTVIKDTSPVDAQALAARIHHCLASLPALRLHAVSDPLGRPAQTPSGVARLTLVLSGQRRVAWRADGRVRIHTLHRGEGIVVTPSGWSQPRSPQQPHHYLSVDAHPDTIRFMCEGSGGGEQQAGSGEFYAPSAPMAPARALLTALIALAEIGAEDRLGPVASCYLSEILRQCRRPDQHVPGADDWRRAAVYARDHLDPLLGRDRLAAAVGVHPNHLSRLCQRCTGESLSEFLAGLRLDRARRLLADPALPMAVVIDEAGFRDPGHFRRVFRRATGFTPAQWRRRALNAQA